MKTENTQLLTPLEAANYLGVTVGTLNVWRCTGRYSLPFVKVGRRVRYTRSHLDDFIERRTTQNGVKGGV